MVDELLKYRKLFDFEEPGERVIILQTAGSLSVTQTVLARLREAVEDPESSDVPSIMEAPTMLRVAEIVGARLGWDAQRQAAEVEQYLESAHREYDVPGA